jgi:hypothetical protein
MRLPVAKPGRARSRRRPPGSLVWLLAIVVIVGLSWALLVPPWQSPDEVQHFAYAQTLAESLRLPGGKGRPPASTDQLIADAAVGASRGAFYPDSSPPNWSRADYDAYLAETHTRPGPSRTNGGGENPAGPNPPFYYLYADIAYLVDHGGTAFGRLYAMQIWGVLLLALSTLAGWLLAGEILGRRRLPQLACAAIVGLMPMQTFISTSVNPDAMMVTLWTFALWLGARVINRRARVTDAVALCAVTAAAILTKATSYALVPPVALALAVGWRRRPQQERRASARALAVAGLVLVAPVLGWLAAASALGRSAVNTIQTSSASHPFNIRQFVSYVWQFYLPRLPFQRSFRTTPELPVYAIWIRQGIGAFGWVSVGLPGWLYTAGAAAAGGIAIAAVALLTRIRGRTRLALLAFLALALLALLGGLHLTDYRSIIAGQGGILQGRYLLPVVGLLGLAAGLIVARLPLKLAPTACGLVLASLLTLQAISLSSVLQAYYL